MWEKINIEVDKLTRLALTNGVGEEDFISSDFPFEQVHLKLNGRKVTRSPRKAISLNRSTGIAREYFHAKRIVNRYDFNSIWWDGVESEMTKFPQMFCSFVTKQVSKFCGTNQQLS